MTGTGDWRLSIVHQTANFPPFRVGSWAMPVAIALLHLWLGLLAFSQAPATGGDDAAYVALARSLIERHDYTNIGDPALLPHTQYPPVFPAILSLGLLADLSPGLGLRILAIVISAAAVLASCVWLQRVASRGVAVSAGFFIAVSPEIVRLGQGVLSDAPFWCFSILALLAWQRAGSTGVRSDGAAWVMPLESVIVASVATVLAYFTRAAGAPLLIAVFVWLGMLRQRRAIAVLAGISIPLILIWWYRGHVSGSEGYLAPFLAADPYNPSLGNIEATELVKRVAGNVSAYATRQLPRLVLGTPLAGIAFGSVFAAAVLFGLTRRLRHVSLPEIWFLHYVTLVLLWPVAWSGPRFLLPVVPLMALYACETAAAIVRRGTYPRLYTALAFGSMAYFILPTSMNQITYAASCRSEFARGDEFPCTDQVMRDFLVTAQHARGRLPEGAVVLSRKPTLFFHYSGYRSRPYPMFAVSDSLFRLADRLGARYFVADHISDLAPRYLTPILKSHRESFCVIPELSTGTTTLFRIESRRRPAVSADVPDSYRVCDTDSRFVSFASGKDDPQSPPGL